MQQYSRRASNPILKRKQQMNTSKAFPEVTWAKACAFVRAHTLPALLAGLF